jgi:hypothetical protein
MVVAAAIGVPALLPLQAHAQPGAPTVPAAWADVDLTLSYESALSRALKPGDRAPLRSAQQQIAGEGTPTHARLMARLNALARDQAAALQLGPCHYAAVLVRGMLLEAYESSGGGRHAVDAPPTDEQVAQYAEHIGRCERLGRRPPSQRLIGGG